MSEWISVEEALPEEQKIVLVGWVGCDRVYIGYFTSTKMWRRYVSDAVSSRPGPEIMTPTHWQPRPEPPEHSGPFYTQASQRGIDDSVWCRDFGFICLQDTQGLAMVVCDRLNKLWRLDLDKAPAARKQDVQDRLDKIWEDLDKGSDKE